jgi:tRNA-binding protein
VATIEDFERLEIRVGTVVDAQPMSGDGKSYIRLWIDFGAALGVKTSAAQITVHYKCDLLIGRQVLAVTNLPPKRVAGFDSDVLMLGVPDEDDVVVLLKPDFKAPNGGRVF